MVAHEERKSGVLEPEFATLPGLLSGTRNHRRLAHSRRVPVCPAPRPPRPAEDGIQRVTPVGLPGRTSARAELFAKQAGTSAPLSHRCRGRSTANRKGARSHSNASGRAALPGSEFVCCLSPYRAVKSHGVASRNFCAVNWGSSSGLADRGPLNCRSRRYINCRGCAANLRSGHFLEVGDKLCRSLRRRCGYRVWANRQSGIAPRVVSGISTSS